MSTIVRTAIVRGPGVSLQRVSAYLPRNYEVQGWDDDGKAVVIAGTDSAGWTMQDYVVPRLASGLLFAEEVTS
jgi:hypothetical protein